jgi:nitrogen fixation protein NifU and related proteins
MSDEARERLLDHANNRRYNGALDHFDIDHAVQSQTCSDWLRLTIQLDGSYNIAAIGWEGDGCPVSQATASMLGEHLIGMPLIQAQTISPDDILNMVGMSLSPQREKCALLSLQVLQEAVSLYMGE